jgi:phosphatidylserine/phosphatidylglycerophosphate/cardiolipin synthase-like enzyme
MRTCRSLLSVTALVVVACGGGVGCSGAPDDVSEEEVSVGQARAALDIHPLDVWAQPLVLKDVRLTVKRNGVLVPVKMGTTTTVFLRYAGAYAIHLEAPQHEPLDVTVRYDGGTTDGSAKIDSVKGGASAFGHARHTFAGRALEAHEVYLGLRHKWFSAEGRPARHGNAVRFMMDGEEAWSTVKKDLDRATKDVMVSTWWWESDFELVRSPIGTSSDDRWKNTILGTLEASPAYKRVLVGEFFGQDTLWQLLNTDTKLRAHASNPGDRFEMMGQANDTRGRFHFEVPAFAFGDRVKNAFGDAPAIESDTQVVSPVPAHDVDLTQVPFHVDVPLASYHQKFMVVDDETAFVGGMNLRHVDWDSSEHEVYDERRMKFDAWTMTRNLVASKSRKPDTGPRKDYMVRIDGPAAQDVADVFHERWEHLRTIGAKYSDQSSSFAVKRDIAPRNGGIDMQVTATLPSPFLEHAIAETWFNAIEHAEKYVYVEDQYFRMPMIHDALIARMDANPNLQLVVITKAVGTWAPECRPSYEANQLFLSRYPERFLSLQLRSFDSDTKEFADIDTHSKMLVVDDVFMSVGSANKNNRGMVYEAELNVAVADPVVASWRKRIVSNLLGGQIAADDVKTWVGALRAAAKANDVAYGQQGNGAKPTGFAYGLTMGAPQTCKMQSVGPDET